MALEKVITDERGIAASYHRIESISNDSGDVKVTVISYASQKYRDEEIELKERVKHHFDLGVRVAKLCEKAPEERTKEEEAEIQALLKEQMEMGEVSYVTDRSIGNKIYQIDLETNNKKDSSIISFDSIYNKLKELDEFKDAKDV